MTTVSAEDSRKLARFRHQRLAFRELPLLLVLAGVVAFFSFTSSGFFNPVNLGSIGRDTAVIGLMAIGLTCVVITGGIDLSCASLLALSASVMALLMQRQVNSGVAILAGLVCALTLGGVNALLVTRLAVPPIVATLATLSLYRMQAIKAVTLISPLPAGLAVVSQGWVASLILAAALIISHAVLQRTAFGRHIYAVGGNPAAAKLAGLPVGRVIAGTYILSGLCAGAAGVIASGMMNSVQGNMLGGYELDTVAAVVIGGTSITGGRGSVIGSVIGAAIMAALRNGLVVSGRDVYWYQTIIGLTILAVGMVDLKTSEKSRSAAR